MPDDDGHDFDGLDRLQGLEGDLRVLADHGAGRSHGLPAGDVRRLGRRRRTTRLVSSAAALVLVLGAGAAVVTGGGDDTVTAPPAGPTLTASALPEVFRWHPGQDDLRYELSSTRPAGTRTSVCERDETLADLSPTALVVGGYREVLELGPGEVDGSSWPDGELRIAVAQFDDAARARAAYDEVTSWVEGCRANSRPDRETNIWETGKPVKRYSDVDSSDGTGWTALITYDETPAVDPDASVIDGHAVGLTAAGHRIVLVSQPSMSMDYNWEPGEAPITQALEEALANATTAGPAAG